jgi:hypothetical protein
MLKQTAIVAIFFLTSVFSLSIATAKSAVTNVDHGKEVIAPQAPVGHGLCFPGMKC